MAVARRSARLLARPGPTMRPPAALEAEAYRRAESRRQLEKRQSTVTDADAVVRAPHGEVTTRTRCAWARGNAPRRGSGHDGAGSKPQVGSPPHPSNEVVELYPWRLHVSRVEHAPSTTASEQHLWEEWGTLEEGLGGHGWTWVSRTSMGSGHAAWRIGERQPTRRQHPGVSH